VDQQGASLSPFYLINLLLDLLFSEKEKDKLFFGTAQTLFFFPRPPIRPRPL
jgi:hypothetical protein